MVWCGQVTHVINDDVGNIRSPETLYKILLTMLPDDSAGMAALDSRGEGDASADEVNSQQTRQECALPAAPRTKEVRVKDIETLRYEHYPSAGSLSKSI